VISFKISTTINRPVDVVADALMNPDNSPYWQKYLERFEVIESKPGGTGSIARLHYMEHGRTYILDDRMIYCEPGKKYISQVSGDAITARVETTLNASGNTTGITIEWSGQGKILLLKLLLPFLRRRFIRQSEEELETFKNLVETRGSNFTFKK